MPSRIGDDKMITVLHLRNAVTGGQYRKTLQYGYDRQQGIDRWMGQKLNGLNPWEERPEHKQELLEDMYACAFLCPRYPVPAINCCQWCGKECMTCPIHELKCLRIRTDAWTFECLMSRL